MMSSAVDLLLLAALVLTSASVIATHRRLKRLDAYHADYQRIFAETGAALAAARDAVEALNADGRTLAATLGERIDEANAVLKALEGRRDEAAVRLATPGGALRDLATLLRGRPSSGASGAQPGAAAAERR